MFGLFEMIRAHNQRMRERNERRGRETSTERTRREWCVLLRRRRRLMLYFVRQGGDDAL